MDKRWVHVLRGTSATLAVGVLVGVGAVGAVRNADASDAPSVSTSASLVFPDASDRQLGVLKATVASSTLPVTVQLKRNGTVLQTQTIRTSGATVSFATGALTTGVYAVAASDGQDVTVKRVRVYRGWAPIDSSRPSWTPCSTVTWRYDSSNAPRGGGIDMVKDIRESLATLHDATGLNFTRVTTGGTLVVRWGDAGGADGLGGLSWTAGPGSVTKGFIELNTSSQWAKTPGADERGVLLLHEGSHALGLGHVDKDTALMSPTYRPGITNASLGNAERAAYVQMYHPGNCPD